LKALGRLEFEAIVEAIPAGVVVIDNENGKVVYANDRAIALYGVDLYGLEIANQSTTKLKLLTLEDKPYPAEKLPVNKAWRTGIEAKDELIIERPNGSRVVVAASAKPIHDEKGNIIASIGIFDDITKRKVFEEQVEQERETLKGIIESTETMIAYLDLNFNFLIVNTAYANASGYTADQLVGKNHFKLFPNEENQAIFKGVRDTGKPVMFLDKPFEFANQPHKGVTYWDWTLTPAKDNEGKVYGLVLTLMETTERKKAEEALRVSEERFRLVAEAANVLVYELEIGNKHSTIIRGEEVLGYRKGEIPTSSEWWFAQVHPEDRGATEVKLQNAIDTCSDVLLEYRMQRKKGDYIIIHDQIKAMCNEQRRVTRLVGGVRDVTERKKAEQAVKEYAQRLELAQHVARLGSWEFFVKDNRAVWSRELFNMFARKPEEGAPNIVEYSKLIYPDDIKDVADRMQRFIGEGKVGETVSFDYRIPRPDGSVRYLHTERMIISVNNTGKAEHIIGIEHDITERKKAEEQLERYAKQMEELANERAKKLQSAERLAAIGATAGMVGHDIRNPLQAMMGDVYLLKDFLELMPEVPIKRDVAESLDSLESNISYVNKIVADLQDYARPLKPEYTEIWVKDLINGVLTTIALPRNIQLKLDVEELRVVTEPTFMKRALTNLVNNAVQAMPDGGELGLMARRKDNCLMIAVSDTGPGIPAEIKPKLFTPLMTTKAKGQGLGLAVVKRLIEGLNGKIDFESQEGKGTKFVIELPITQ
jgi:PAS domain S-box-containing protein